MPLQVSITGAWIWLTAYAEQLYNDQHGQTPRKRAPDARRRKARIRLVPCKAGRSPPRLSRARTDHRTRTDLRIGTDPGLESSPKLVGSLGLETLQDWVRQRLP
jgi:hypothetical protein